MAIKSTAEDKGDHWLLNGTKTWISNATVGGINIYYAYTDRSQGARGLSAFVLELDDKSGPGEDHESALGVAGIAAFLSNAMFWNQKGRNSI